MKLQKVSIKSREDHKTNTGGAHFHIFIKNETGEELIERTTAEQHALMKGVDGVKYNPVKKGYTWSHTVGRNEYDTPDGELGEGQYAVDGDYCECRPFGLSRREIIQIPKEKIVGNEIMDSYLENELQKIDDRYRTKLVEKLNFEIKK